jgi:adenylate cyclase
VRIVIQLVDGQTGSQPWAERYDRDLTDIFAVQDEVTGEIVSALAVKLTQGEQRRMQRVDTDNLEAYDNYLRGRQLVLQRSGKAVEEARPLLERAIELDSQFARAYSMLACTHILDHVNGWHEAGGESLEKAHEFAQAAVKRDADDAEAHWALGWTHLLRRQHDRAMDEARKALRCDPSFGWAHSLLGQVLHYSGRSAEALQPLATALRLDPNNHQDPHLHYLAQAYVRMGRYEEAAAILRRRIVCKPDTDMSRVLLASCYGHLGRVTEARMLWQEALLINPGYSLEHCRCVLPYKDPADFEQMVEGLRKAGLQG